ncbi:hypothetical protein EB796_002202 [Bugula neritina]|uniref:Uncharacterized protein n=1 Tax=Bugula neritina TaxID=10212 RepID=A0A7J7KMW7_BUGNE|nr:hypothetical protein EB796_002202 [Bugula neritina]
MREYFKAFAEQNKRHRDYEPYLRAFLSDRHSIEADTWFQLQEDVMASLWGGKKDVNENLATLPTVIIGVNEDGSPRMAQWNYKILTHPISFDIPLNRFRPIDDLSVMVRNFKNLEDLAKTRSCRFQLNPLPKDEPYDGVWREEQSTGYVNYLEQLMKEVPGLDNYPADIKDDFLGAAPLQEPDDSSDELNTGYYSNAVCLLVKQDNIQLIVTTLIFLSRYYSLSKRDASGFSKSARGFADANLFVAQNNQSKWLLFGSDSAIEGTVSMMKCESLTPSPGDPVPHTSTLLESL